MVKEVLQPALRGRNIFYYDRTLRYEILEMRKISDTMYTDDFDHNNGRGWYKVRVHVGRFADNDVRVQRDLYYGSIFGHFTGGRD